ncbi:hypothetical protein PV328_001591 [Microctonus aethiopoides]|uniref:CUE domain-containing protein n=1 Tax=Microctonus aethiopoides TaxID=144406 RepID=A0AA39KXN4_9HYME|nr:hypothetical protein PV328_001591 [Microctonus aethiopoides]
MPTVFLNRVPLPSFRVYTAISIGILSCSLYYAAQIVKDPEWRTNHTTIIDKNENSTDSTNSNDPRTAGMHFKELIACMIQEPVCFWVQQLFPHYPRNVVLEDLRITRSVELTIENILDGRLILPHRVIGELEAEPVTQNQSVTNHILPNTLTDKLWDPKLDITVPDRILQRRKEHMLLTARRKYVERHRKSEVELSQQRTTNNVNVANS